MFAASAAVGGLIILGTPAPVAAQAASVAGHRASLDPGEIAGVVRDEAGEPLAGTMVSALGATTAFTFTDREGRFELSALPPGAYLLRAHAKGFHSPKPEWVEVRPGARVDSTIALKDGSQPAVLAAGFGASGLQDLPPMRIAPVEETADEDHDDHGETAWRLRHARRGVLRSASHPEWVPDDAFVDDGMFGSPDGYRPAMGVPVRVAASLVADTDFSGQVNFLTSGSFDHPDQLFTGDNFSRGIANVRVGMPMGDGDWMIAGALTQTDISAWIVAGSYATRTQARHKYDVGMSYSTQRYDGGNPLALRSVTEGSRNVGSVHAFDTLTASPELAVTYGGRYARYDYLDRRALVSPRVEVTVTSADDVRFSAAVSRRAHAPGAEEFLPPAETGIWLPPQRTFSSIEPGEPMRAERSTHVVLSVERDFDWSGITVRAYRQDISDQLATVFGAEIPGQPAAKLGHYLVGNAGDATVLGWSAEFRSSWNDRVRGSIGYSQAHAQMTPATNLHYLVLVAPSTVRSQAERIHDISTTIEADVPETATKVLVVYRASTGFAQPGPVASTDRPFDSRFDLQLRQSLPFMSFSNAKWEMLLAVRNFFRETNDHQSIYDELLVVRPPTRVVGGVTLHF